MGQKRDERSDWLTEALKRRTRQQLGVNGWSVAELARRLKTDPSNMIRYLHEGETAYGSWTLALVLGIAAAFGITLGQFLGDLIEKASGLTPGELWKPQGVWDPSSQQAAQMLGTFAQHEEKATEGIGFFRVPPCTILLPGMSKNIYLNKFGLLHEYGQRIIEAYEEIEQTYRAEYLAVGGRYANFALKTIVFESEIKSLIRGEGIYQRCAADAWLWLHRLLEDHVNGMGYMIGFVNDLRLPPGIVYDLLDTDPVITVGNSLSVRRQAGTFRLLPCTGGEQLLRDQLCLRILCEHADFSIGGMTTKINKFRRAADNPGKRLED